jgi:hypothetical protein
MILFTTLARLDSSIEKEILIWEMKNGRSLMAFFIAFFTAVSLEDFLVFLLEMADYISGASS